MVITCSCTVLFVSRFLKQRVVLAYTAFTCSLQCRVPVWMPFCVLVRFPNALRTEIEPPGQVPTRQDFTSW